MDSETHRLFRVTFFSIFSSLFSEVANLFCSAYFKMWVPSTFMLSTRLFWTICPLRSNLVFMGTQHPLDCLNSISPRSGLFLRKLRARDCTSAWSLPSLTTGGCGKFGCSRLTKSSLVRVRKTRPTCFWGKKKRIYFTSFSVHLLVAVRAEKDSFMSCPFEPERLLCLGFLPRHLFAAKMHTSLRKSNGILEVIAF